MPVERESFTGTEIRAGIMVLLSVAVLLVLIAGILRFRPRGDTNTFYVPMSDIGGLDRAADVRFGGMVVGRVTEIVPDPQNHTQMIVTAKVRTSTPVNAGSTAFAGQTTLTAEKHLEITTGRPDAPLLKDGDTIPSIAGGGMFGDLTALTQTAQELLVDLKLLLGVTDADGRTLFVPEDSRTVADIFDNLDGLMSDMRVILGVVDEKGELVPVEDRKTLTELMDGLDGALADGRGLINKTHEILDENRQTIQDALDNANELVLSADEFINNADQLLADNKENIEQTVENLKALLVDTRELVSTLQQVLDENSPAIEDALDTLNDALNNVEELTRTLADQPQSLIRGREPVGRP